MKITEQQLRGIVKRIVAEYAEPDPYAEPETPGEEGVDMYGLPSEEWPEEAGLSAQDYDEDEPMQVRLDALRARDRFGRLR